MGSKTIWQRLRMILALDAEFSAWLSEHWHAVYTDIVDNTNKYPGFYDEVLSEHRRHVKANTMFLDKNSKLIKETTLRLMSEEQFSNFITALEDRVMYELDEARSTGNYSNMPEIRLVMGDKEYLVGYSPILHEGLIRIVKEEMNDLF